MGAAALRVFNDSHNAQLINPTSSIFKRNPLTEDEQERYNLIAALYRDGDTESLRAYCKAIMQDDQLFAKVADYKKSTITAFAYAGCDAPLCAQLVFLYEWLQEHSSEALATPQVGRWHVADKQRPFTAIDLENTENATSDNVPGVQPTLKDPCDEDVLLNMREVLQKYLFSHLKRVSSQDCLPPSSPGAKKRKPTLTRALSTPTPAGNQLEEMTEIA